VLTAIRVRAAFVAAATVWALLLVATPWLASRPHASAPASVLIVAVYGIGNLVCHQLPARSYHPWGAQMPVCARCAGIYFGAVLGALAAIGARGVQRNGRRSPHRLALRHARPLLALALAPTALTLVYEWTTGDMPAHAIRFAAGLSIGVVVAWLIVAAADNQVN
jgi:hypothetical protein